MVETNGSNLLHSSRPDRFDNVGIRERIENPDIRIVHQEVDFLGEGRVAEVRDCFDTRRGEERREGFAIDGGDDAQETFIRDEKDATRERVCRDRKYEFDCGREMEEGMSEDVDVEDA